jgi:hypothetical protein
MSAIAALRPVSFRPYRVRHACELYLRELGVDAGWGKTHVGCVHKHCGLHQAGEVGLESTHQQGA